MKIMKSLIIIGILILSGLTTHAGGGSYNGGNIPNTPFVPLKELNLELFMNGKSSENSPHLYLNEGESINFSWKTKNANKCFMHRSELGIYNKSVPINGVINTVANGASHYMNFYIYCYGSNTFPGIYSRSVTIIVKAKKPEITLLKSSKSTVFEGETVKINWKTQNVVSCTLNNQTVGLSGERNFVVNKMKSFILICKNKKGTSVLKTVTVFTKKPIIIINNTSLILNSVNTMQFISNYPKIVFKLDNVFVKRGTSAKLTWSSQGAVKCTINNQKVALNGSMTISPNKMTTYKLNCVNSVGKTGATGYGYKTALVIN